MKINEFTNNLQTYIATVRVITASGSVTARIAVNADGPTQCRMILNRLYGVENIISISQITTEDDVTEATKTLSSEELQVKSLADRSKQLNQQAKQLKARQQFAKAQQNLMQASRGASAS